MGGGAWWAACSPWGCEESDMTERLHFHFSLSCIGEGNGNTPQCSCLENPRDGGAWWAAVYGVAQSQTWLKRLSSSSSSRSYTTFLVTISKWCQLWLMETWTQCNLPINHTTHNSAKILWAFSPHSSVSQPCLICPSNMEQKCSFLPKTVSSS